MKTKIRPKFPLIIDDLLIHQARQIPITLEIHEECVVALLPADVDFFSEGKTIQEAKENLLRGLADEWKFLRKHQDELSAELGAKYRLLKKLFA